MNRSYAIRALASDLAALLVVLALVLGLTGSLHAAAEPTPFRFTPFTEELPIPPVVKEIPAFDTTQCDKEFPAALTSLKAPKFYEITMKEAVVQMIPGVNTRIWGYDGMTPGPTFKVKHDEPAIVRFFNDLSATTIVHNHGAHVPALSDGSASVNPEMLIPPGEFRDFCYPNIAPINPVTGEEEISDFASTQWYHDHAHLPSIDLGITGQNVYMGLAGYFWLTDELEQGLIDNNVLPSEKFDIPIVLQDKRFAPDGELVFDLSGFDGNLGDVMVINGKAQPKFTVERRKYRFRFLNGATARWFELRLSSGDFIQIGSDTWLLPEAVRPATFVGNERRDGTIRLGNAERADVIIDFSNAPDEVFLENILPQDNGRRPNDEVRIPGFPLIKFVVQGPPVANDATVTVGTSLRPHKAITADEISASRTFEFARSGGQWVVNGLNFHPERDDAKPALNSAERWVLKNGGGGWAHPIHIHDEAMQVQSINGRSLDPQERFKKDTVRLEPGEEAEIFIKFRTFAGRFVSHCHNLEHEDLAMMLTFNVDATPVPDFENLRDGDNAQGTPPLTVIPK